MPKAAESTQPSESEPSIELLAPETKGLGAEPITSYESVSTGTDGDSIFGRPWVVVPLSILAIVVALTVISRPGPPVEEPAPQTTLPPPTTVAPSDSVGAGVAVDATRPMPLFGGNLPSDLPGVISGYDDDGSLVVIDREAEGPTEHVLGVSLTDTAPATVVMVDGAPPVGFVQELVFNGRQLEFRVSRDDPDPSIALTEIIPDASVDVLFLYRGNNVTQVVSAMAPASAASAPDGAPDLLSTEVWDVPGHPNVIGQWNGALVVERAGSVWLLDAAGTAVDVADGQVLSYDGKHLARLDCDGPVACTIKVGPPDAPDRYAAPLPEELTPLGQDLWASSVAVSPEGDRLAVVVREGGLSQPMVIDLGTGEVQKLQEIIRHDSPLVWSPDGEWLAYRVLDDIKVWRLSAQRSWLIPVDRELQTLLWR
ncbi:MAG: hypothetical protein AAGA59_14460 [Actinomycetota bacterium]